MSETTPSQPVGVDSPYPGLRPFRPDEAEIFFGRTEHTDQLLAKLETTHFLTIIGVSGCGKSSLVRAGLLPALRTGFMGNAGGRWRIAELRPGDRPRMRLAAALAGERILGGERFRDPTSIALIDATLRKGPLGVIELLRESPPPPNTNILVFVDQFEEIFRYRATASADEAEAFVALLLASAANREFPIYVVIAMRSDFLGDCALFRGLPEAINESQYLTPRLTREQIRETIVRPARLFMADVESALVSRLLNEIGPDPDQLPVLQHALMRMWESALRRVEKAGRPVLITEADYREVGSLNSALNDHAEQVLRSVGPCKDPGSEIPDIGAYRIARVLFQRLTERRGGRRDTRRPTRLSEIVAVADANSAAISAVVERFRAPDNSFLATATSAPDDPSGSADEIIDIGHESLIRKWKRLSVWVAQEAGSAATYKRLLETAHLWRIGRSALWVDPDLAESLKWRAEEAPTEPWARRYAEGNAAEDFALAMKFLDESAAEAARKKALEEARARERSVQEARERDLARQARTAWIFRSLAGALAVAVIGAVYFGKSAQYAGRVASARELAAVGAARLDVEPNVAAALALRSLETSNTTQGEVLLRQSLFRMADAVFRGHDSKVTKIAYSPDGRRLVTAYADHVIEVRNLDNGSITRVLQPKAESQKGSVNAITFAADGETLAIAIAYVESDDRRGEVLIADASAKGSSHVLRAPDRIGASCALPIFARAKSGRQRAVVEPANPLSLAVDRVHNVLVSGWSDGRIVLFDLAKSYKSLVLDPEPKYCTPMRAVHVDQEGKKIYGARSDRVVFVWNADSPDSRPDRFEIAGSKDFALEGFAVDAHGRRGAALLTPTPVFGRRKESYVSVTELKVKSHDNPLELRPAGGDFTDIVFSSGGSEIVAAGTNGNINIMNAEAGTLMRTLRGHSGRVDTLALAPKGLAFSSGGEDATVRTWSLTPLPVRPLVGHGGQSTSVAFSSDGKWLASGGLDGTVRVWDAETAAQRTVLGKHSSSVYAVAVSPDNRRVASVSGGVLEGNNKADRSIRIWDVHDGTLLLKFDPPADVLSVAFSPDGKLLGAVGAEPMLRLWDANTGDQAAELRVVDSKDGSALGLSFSPDGQRIVAAGSDGIAPVYDVASRKLIYSLKAGGFQLSTAAFGDRGRRVLTSSTATSSIEVWNANDGTLALRFKGYANTNGSDLSGDSTLAVTADMFGPPRLWDSRTGSFLTALSGENAWGAVFAPDATKIATTSGEGTIFLYDCAPCGRLTDVKRLARERLKSALTDEQEKSVATQ